AGSPSRRSSATLAAPRSGSARPPERRFSAAENAETDNRGRPIRRREIPVPSAAGSKPHLGNRAAGERRGRNNTSKTGPSTRSAGSSPTPSRNSAQGRNPVPVAPREQSGMRRTPGMPRTPAGPPCAPDSKRGITGPCVSGLALLFRRMFFIPAAVLVVITAIGGARLHLIEDDAKQRRLAELVPKLACNIVRCTRRL